MSETANAATPRGAAKPTDEQTAVLYSAKEPTDEQYRRLEAFILRTCGAALPLRWERSEDVRGFRLRVGRAVYDWSLAGRVRQLRERMHGAVSDDGDVLPLLHTAIKDFSPAVLPDEHGTVRSVGDGIARVEGLPNAAYGEVLAFADGSFGMVQDLREDSVGCILFGHGDIAEGSAVQCTGRTAGMPVGQEFLGRVVNALGAPIDGKGPILPDGYRAVESPAPGIVERQSVTTPLETGILCIDSMFPIGRGQRELIIGDRQTGKTAIALDTIINQRGKDVVCIYVAIGQKASSVAQLAATLEKHGALAYTCVVCAAASASASEQFIAPYAGCALAEYFMREGLDVLIVYDDLSKHAVAYRELSLLLERSPGREAYPGDVFYLHSRLLERSARLSDACGGGSITALPIVETQAGDVSAYIPTNVISITDGQIYLESSLFFSGQRPAVNVGLSVSRVGGDAQTKAMKKSVGTLRLDLAQYREMEIFTQFSSDLDETTKRQLVYGQGLMRLLRQAQYRPLQQHQQVILLVSALAHTMQEIPVAELGSYRDALLAEQERVNADVCERIDRTGRLTDSDREAILAAAKDFAAAYLARAAKDGDDHGRN